LPCSPPVEKGPAWTFGAARRRQAANNAEELFLITITAISRANRAPGEDTRAMPFEHRERMADAPSTFSVDGGHRP
jgi:hypothetical protein